MHLFQLRTYLFLAMTALLAPCGVSAQQASLKRADAYFEAQDYHTAASIYEQLLERDPKLGIAKFKAGVCYLFTSMPEKGLEYIKAAPKLTLEMSPYYYFWLGKGYHLNMRLDSALINYRIYLSKAPKNDEYRKGTEVLIAQAHKTESYFVTSDQSPVQAVNLGEGINSPYTERAPLATADGQLLIYSTRRPLYPDEPAGPDGEYYEKAYIALRQPDGAWGKGQILFQPMDKSSHFAPVQLLASDNKLLLYMGGKHGGLYMAAREGNTFGKPMPLQEGIKPGYVSQEVCFSQDMTRMIFSKSHGTEGDLDIFMSAKGRDGAWGTPVRMSAAVNSDEDELAPVFADDDKTIIYASKGHGSIGGFDLFKSKQDPATGKWGAPENLGLPINSPGNDIYLSDRQTAAGRQTYLSSARAKGYGEADLYKIDFAGAQASK